jgi:hypothetical protein
MHAPETTGCSNEDFKKRYQRWKNGNNEMKERKPDVDKKEDTKRMPKERTIGNIQTQNRVYEGHSRLQDGRDWQSTMPLLQHRSISRPHTVGIQRNLDQRTTMNMIKDQWINGAKVMGKMIDYAKEIRLFNEI